MTQATRERRPARLPIVRPLMLTVFLALETLSLSLYCLAAFHRRISISSEAAIKYFLMGAFVSAFALYGIALIYGGTGSTHFEGIGHALAAQPFTNVLTTNTFEMTYTANAFPGTYASTVTLTGSTGP